MPIVAGFDARPSDHVRVEVAFATAPDAANPAYVDLTSRVSLRAGIDIQRGRLDQFDQVQPGRCTLTMDNIDGALTADNPSSPFYPNVLPQKRLHLSYRDPATLGLFNLLANPSFEVDASGWAGFGSGAVVRDNTVTAQDGSWEGKVTYTSSLSGAQSAVSGLVIGRSYVVSAYVWNPVGNPSVAITIAGGTSTRTNLNATWQRISMTFTATSPTDNLQLGVLGTGGTNLFYIDAIQLDEGTTVGPFSGAPAPIGDLFTGYVDEWPLEWPTGDDTFAAAQVSASDMLARLGRHQGLRSVVAETLALDSPQLYYPLGEPAGSVAFSNVAATTQPAMAVTQRGAGGTLVAAAGTGAPTDGASAPVFTPVDASNGLYLSTTLATGIGFFGGTLRANINTTVASREQVAVCLSDVFGARFEIGTDSTGHAFARLWQPFAGTYSPNLTTSTLVADGQTHDLAFTASISGGTITWTFCVDGVSVASTATSGTTINFLGRLTVGGGPASAMFAGTISHVSAQSTALPVARLAEYRAALTTGFSGERSDQRITRIASWCGIPATAQVLDVGNATSVAHVDCTGMNPLDYMRQVETTEVGLLFIDTKGRLTFYNRARAYTASSPAATIPAALLDPPPRPVKNLLGILNDFTGTRPFGTTTRVVNQASVTTYGVAKGQDSYLVNSDAALVDAVNWRVAKQATPNRRIPDLSIDAMTDPSAGPFRSIEIGYHVQVTGLPSQVGSSTVDQIVQGYRLRITDSEWTVTANTTNYGDLLAFVVEDPILGTADGPGVAIF